MKRRLLNVAAAIVVLSWAGTAQAQTLAYSFEGAPPPDGFAANGGGVTVAQDTIGATHLQNSLRMSVVQGATFVGALTGAVHSSINDPPGVQSILFDLTITEAFTGSFAVVGVTIFGASQPDYPGGQQFGLQAQFADFEHIGGKAPGTYPVQIDLTSATHPLTFAAGQTFNQIMGTVGSGQDDVIPTGFQFFVNKSNDATATIYIDNVRVVPEPASLGLAGMVGLALAAARRRAGRG